MRVPAVPVLALLLLGALRGPPEVGAEMNAMKLCGREFIRAVVYTCGGSRWRRFIDQQDWEVLSGLEQSSSEIASESQGSGLSRRESNLDCCHKGCTRSYLTSLC
ncbi:insulin-like peptide INSL5 [Denticeps clupeoides]|uniref:insulin-like peptide INSL5 n=1 Tax=Denticeps clupeoides TaxID=299321 RepID=UPI0010A2FCA5|nr:relaxin-3-like [Denticeps clupeoides]